MKKISALMAAFLITFVSMASLAQSETLQSALARAYTNNPTLNAQRASTRAADEAVPQALSGYRPTITADGDVGKRRSVTRGVGTSAANTTPGSVSLSMTQPVFRGLRTINSTKTAEANVKAARELLRNTEQDILLQAVEAYMNVLRDRAIVQLREQNIVAISEQLRAARDRFEVGEGTRTDVAQSEARLAEAQSRRNLAKANLSASRAVYQQIIGVEPAALNPARPAPANLLPNNQIQAIDIALIEHPIILSSSFNLEAANSNLKTIQGELLPTLSLQGSLSRQWEPSATTDSSDSATISGRVSVPLYQAGAVSSRVRQAKQTLAQSRLELDVSREQIRAAVISAKGSLAASRASVTAAKSQVRASRIALEGVSEERRVGQRTTLDVLDAQQELLNAQVNLVTAERDTVVASYNLLSSIGRLNARILSLNVSLYDAQMHYRQVRDKWFGLRTPSGQ